MPKDLVTENRKLKDQILQLEDNLAAANRQIEANEPNMYAFNEAMSALLDLLQGRKVIMVERNLNDESPAYYYITDVRDLSTKD